MDTNLSITTEYCFWVASPDLGPEEIRVIVPANNEKEAQIMYRKYIVALLNEANQVVLERLFPDKPEPSKTKSKRESKKQPKQPKAAKKQIHIKGIEREKEILAIIKSGSSKTKKISERLGICPKAVNVYLNRLKKKGLVILEGSTYNASWKAVQATTSTRQKSKYPPYVGMVKPEDNEYMTKVKQELKDDLVTKKCIFCLSREAETGKELCAECVAHLQFKK